MSILVLKNHPREGLGLIESILNQNHIQFDVVDLDLSEKIPDLQNYTGLIVLGGPDSANDLTPKMIQELNLIKNAVSRDFAYLGICLGLQTLVKACGGDVIKNSVREIGWRDPNGNLFEIGLTSDGKSDKLFNNLNHTIPIFQLHGETVKLTSKMTLLATSKFCTNQIVKVGPKQYGIQGHFELTSEMFENWCKNDPDLQNLDYNSLATDYQKIRKEYEKTCRALIQNFLQLSGLTK